MFFNSDKSINILLLPPTFKISPEGGRMQKGRYSVSFLDLIPFQRLSPVLVDLLHPTPNHVVGTSHMFWAVFCSDLCSVPWYPLQIFIYKKIITYIPFFSFSKKNAFSNKKYLLQDYHLTIDTINSIWKSKGKWWLLLSARSISSPKSKGYYWLNESEDSQNKQKFGIIGSLDTLF